MRLFVACLLTDEIKCRLRAVRVAVGDRAGLKWVEEQNLHVTLKFLGETESAKMGALKDALKECARLGEPFSLCVRGTGKFGSALSPRVLWAGIDTGARALQRLAEAVEAAVEPLGFSREARKFSPHITLARVKEGAKLAGVWDKLLGFRDVVFGSCDVSSFWLMRSDLGRSGPTYTTLEQFCLGTGGRDHNVL